MTRDEIDAQIFARLALGPAIIAELGYSLQTSNGYDKAYRAVMRLKKQGRVHTVKYERGAAVIALTD